MGDSVPWSREEVQHRRVILVGPSGSGKSAIGRLVAERVGWCLHDTDAAILASIEERSIGALFEARGEASFRSLERAQIELISLESNPCIVATGGGLPAIPGMMSRLNAMGLTIYLKASVGELWERITMDVSGLEDRPFLKRGGRAALEQLIQSRLEVYQSAAIVLDTDSLAVGRVRDLIVDVVTRLVRDVAIVDD